MCVQEGLPTRRERGIRLKFNRMVEARRHRDASNSRATGSAEWSTKVDAMLDKYIESEAYSIRGSRRRQWPGPSTSEQDREELAQRAGIIRHDPASRSMSTLRERRSSQSLSQSQPSDTKAPELDDTRTRKQARNTAADAFAALTESTVEHREFEKDYRLKQLGLMQVQVKAQREHNAIMRSGIQTQIGEVRDEQRQMREMLGSIMAMLQSGHTAGP